jgi:peptidoglycan-associated lipoprotein
MMRPNLLASALLSSLLAACATTYDASPSQHVSQSGALKVHPGLLGRPVPAELQDARPVAVAAAVAQQELAMDQDGLRTKRSVYFDFDSSAVKEDFSPALLAHARYLAANPKSQVRIEGNADERGPQGYNNSLGLKRADNVRLAIIAFGAPEKQVQVKSLGELKPKLKGHDEESWAENRRADIVYVREE